MSLVISAVFIWNFEQVLVCKELNYVKVSEFLQMMKVHVTDHHLFL